MSVFNQLCQDEAGAVLSAEVVLVGTVAVLASLTGLNVAANAINDELKEFGYAIRSLDQSYAFAGHRSCCAWTAGSYYRQPDVKQALAELCGESAADIGAIQQQIDADRATATSAPVPETAQPPVEPPPPPNHLPEPAR